MYWNLHSFSKPIKYAKIGAETKKEERDGTIPMPGLDFQGKLHTQGEAKSLFLVFPSSPKMVLLFCTKQEVCFLKTVVTKFRGVKDFT